MFSQPIVVKLKDVDRRLYREMYRLNRSTRSDGISWEMRPFLVRERARHNDSTYISYILDSSNHIATWAISDGYRIMVYARIKYRRMGLSKKAVKKLSKKFDELGYAPHDVTSAKFFKSCIEDGFLSKYYANPYAEELWSFL